MGTATFVNNTYLYILAKLETKNARAPALWKMGGRRREEGRRENAFMLSSHIAQDCQCVWRWTKRFFHYPYKIENFGAENLPKVKSLKLCHTLLIIQFLCLPTVNPNVVHLIQGLPMVRGGETGERWKSRLEYFRN